LAAEILSLHFTLKYKNIVGMCHKSAANINLLS